MSIQTTRPDDPHDRAALTLTIRAARPDDLHGAATARIASWRSAFTGLVPQDFLDAMDPDTIAAGWSASIAAGRSRLYVAAATADADAHPDKGATHTGKSMAADGSAHAGRSRTPTDKSVAADGGFLGNAGDEIPGHTGDEILAHTEGGILGHTGDRNPPPRHSLHAISRVDTNIACRSEDHRGQRMILGYAGVGPERSGAADAGELYALYVHPDAWGTGVGRALTDAAVGDLREAGYKSVTLWVLEANDRARAFYQRYGFTETPDRTHSSLANLPELRLTLDAALRGLDVRKQTCE